MSGYPKRLIEVDLPIKKISAHARREKSIRHGHISTLHIWWARRPLAACRAVLCAALWPDPADPLCPQEFRDNACRLINEFAAKAGRDVEMANWCDVRLIVIGLRAEVLGFSRLTRSRPESFFERGMLEGEGKAPFSERAQRLGPNHLKKMYEFQVRNGNGYEHIRLASRDYPALGFILVYGDLNVDEYGSYFIQCGRARSYHLSFRQKGAMWARHDATTNEEIDEDERLSQVCKEMMEMAEAHWKQATLLAGSWQEEGTRTENMSRAEISSVKDLHKKWMRDGKYRQAHEALAPEFELARALIQARVRAGLTQEEMASRMRTTQSVVARLLKSPRIRWGVEARREVQNCFLLALPRSPWLGMWTAVRPRPPIWASSQRGSMRGSRWDGVEMVSGRREIGKMAAGCN